MFKILLILSFFLAVLKCEKPEPQKPKVLFSAQYTDSLMMDSLNKKVERNDSIKIGKDTVNLPKEVNLTLIKYRNNRKEILTVSYSSKDSASYVMVNFPSKNLNLKLNANSSNSNIYTSNGVKWELKNSKNLGVLTINGTWFEFIKTDED